MISPSMVLPDVGFTHVHLVMGILADPAAYAERLKALEAANAEAKAAIDEANQKSAAADKREAETDADCARKIAATDQQITNLKNNAAQAIREREHALRGQEMVAHEAAAAAKIAREEAEQLRDDLRRRIAIVQSAA